MQLPRRDDIFVFEGRAHRIDEVIWHHPSVLAEDVIEVHLKSRTFGT